MVRRQGVVNELPFAAEDGEAAALFIGLVTGEDVVGQRDPFAVGCADASAPRVGRTTGAIAQEEVAVQGGVGLVRVNPAPAAEGAVIRRHVLDEAVSLQRRPASVDVETASRAASRRGRPRGVIGDESIVAQQRRRLGKDAAAPVAERLARCAVEIGAVVVADEVAGGEMLSPFEEESPAQAVLPSGPGSLVAREAVADERGGAVVEADRPAFAVLIEGGDIVGEVVVLDLRLAPVEIERPAPAPIAERRGQILVEGIPAQMQRGRR